MFTCTSCGVAKDAAQFFKQRTCKRGHMAECKSCSMARNRRWANENRERYRAINRVASARKRTKDPRTALFKGRRWDALKRGIPFEIEVDDLVWPEVCPVFGTPLTYNMGAGRFGGVPSAASLDRIDNTRGYVKGNVVIVSWRANHLKKDATPTELRKLADYYERVGRPDTEAPG